MAITKIQSNAFPTTIDLSNVDLTLGAGEVLTANIADANVTHAKLHTDMNLTSKTVVLPTLNQNLTVSGNIVVSGTVDGVDVAAASTKLTAAITGAGLNSNGTYSPPTSTTYTLVNTITNTPYSYDTSSSFYFGSSYGWSPSAGAYKIEVLSYPQGTLIYSGIGEIQVATINAFLATNLDTPVSGLFTNVNYIYKIYTAATVTANYIGSATSLSNAAAILDDTLALKANINNPSFTGNVGIGTATPDEALDIEKSGANLRLYNNTGVGTSIIMLDTIYQGGIGMDSGNLYFRTGGQNNRWMINTSGDFIPSANDSYDIGSITSVVRNIYTGDLHLSNEAKYEGNEVDGTKGSWTIQEGEEHLYIINNKNGKKYRFALEEIQ